MQKKLTLALFEKQTTVDTPSTVLTSNDYVDLLEAHAMDIEPEVEADNRGGGAFQNNPPTIGRYGTDISFIFALYSRGVNYEPSFIRCLECAGWEKRLDNPNIIMVPRNEIIHAGTLWGYRGGPGTNKSLLSKYGNIMFDWTLSLEAGKRATMTLPGKGKFVGRPGVATQPNVDAYRERQVAPPTMQATVQINGQAYKFLKFDFIGGQSVENNVDAADTYGGGDTEITERNITWTATVYTKPTFALIPHANMHNSVPGILDFQWGRKHNFPDVRLYAPGSVITGIKESDNNGVLTWDLTGMIVDNDMELRIYNGTTSSYSTSSYSDSSDSNSSESASNSSDSSSSLSNSSSSASDSISSVSSESSTSA